MEHVRAALHDLFGFAAFRPGQEPVVRAALDGRDLLALMPTGAGKSLTYQLAAMLRPEPTLVLSPLIALMKDQVDKLPPSVAAKATFVNSSLPAGEGAARLEAVRAGRYRLLYAAPERLRQASFVEALRKVGVGLVVVDEVHCVSMWGHDFRPDYLFIGRALGELGSPALLGMTATATPATAEAIAEALGRDPEVVRTSVARPNLRYDVERAESADARLAALLERLRGLSGAAAIVYARSRRACEDVARLLQGYGIRAGHYHAGLEHEARTRVQDAFLSGGLQVVVATTAFGMGVDKPDVRLVCLLNHPDSLESYVQMVGRAGRDGAPSDTLLLAGRADAASLRRFVLAGAPTATHLRAAYRAVRDGGGVVDPDGLAAVAGAHDPRVLVGMLEQAGLARRGYDEGRLLRVELLSAPDDAASRIEGLLTRYAAAASARVERVIDFGGSERCRHAQVAEHFGEEAGGACDACDVCAPRRRPRRAAHPAPPLPDEVGAAVVAAVARLPWPVGRRSLVATLRGSPQAPPSARRAEAFGLLRAATEAEVRRWVGALVAAGALAEVVTDDGFRVLRAVAGAAVPELRTGTGAAVDAALEDRLRAWRRERSRADGVPAYVVLNDATLRELAAVRPSDRAGLARITGIGPARLDRYGDDVLALIAVT